MPPSTPTLRQQRLGAELRKLREHAGLTSSAAAGLLGVKQAQISSIESGRYAVSADRVRTFARIYSCADPALVDALAAMTGGRTRGWWDEYREHLPVGLIDLAELEHYATELRVALVIHIPALLQTTDHARSLFRGVFPLCSSTRSSTGSPIASSGRASSTGRNPLRTRRRSTRRR